jgi:hypothetical protein
LLYPQDSEKATALYDDAFNKYAKAVEVKPDYHEAWYGWGNSLGVLAGLLYPQDSEKATALYHDAFNKYAKAVEVKPDKHEAWYNWGNSLGVLAGLLYPQDSEKATALYEDAEKKLKRSLELFELPETYGALGAVHFRMGEVEEGIEEKATSAWLFALSDNPSFINELGSVWYYRQEAGTAFPLVLKCGAALAASLKIMNVELREWPADLLQTLDENGSYLDERSSLLMDWVNDREFDVSNIPEEILSIDDTATPIDRLLAFLVLALLERER